MYVISGALAKFISINRSDPLLFSATIFISYDIINQEVDPNLLTADLLCAPMRMMMSVLDPGL